MIIQSYFFNRTLTALPELFKGVIFRMNSLAWPEHPTIPTQIYGLWVHVHAVWCKAACGVSDIHVVWVGCVEWCAHAVWGKVACSVSDSHVVWVGCVEGCRPFVLLPWPNWWCLVWLPPSLNHLFFFGIWLGQHRFLVLVNNGGIYNRD